MKNYDVYFEMFGKKLKTTVLAKDEEDAKAVLKDKIKFHKVELKYKDDWNELADIMDDFLRPLKN